MKPARFTYHRPETVEETVRALAAYGTDAVVLAGGQSLLPLLNQRRIRPKMVIDITRLPGLDNMVDTEQGVSIGALLRQSRVTPAAVPLLGMALEHVGHIQTRHRGTIAGSLAYGDPMAELPLAWLVCGGTIDLVSTTGTRTVAADQFFDEPFRPLRRPDELVTGLSLHRSPVDAGLAFVEVTHNVTLGVAAAMASRSDSQPGSGSMTVRVAVAANASGPRLTIIDDVDPASIGTLAGDLAESAVSACEFVGDVHADARYRRHLAHTLADRALRSALADALSAEATV